MFRIGLIVPSSNTVMEPDFHRILGSHSTVSTARLFLEEVTREAEIRMIDEDLPRALRLLKTTAPHAIVFGCTSAGSLGGLEHDTGLVRMMEAATGAVGVTVVGSIVDELRRSAPSRVAVFTPYLEDLTASVVSCVREAGYSVVHQAGMGLLENLSIGRVPPDDIVEFVMEGMRGVEADCVFLSCTNWQAVSAISTLRDRLHLPVISSNQATAQAVARLRDRALAAAS